MNDEEINSKIVKEQDILINNGTEVFDCIQLYIKEPRLKYNKAVDRIKENDELLNQMSIKNLNKLILTYDRRKDVDEIEKIRKIILHKLDTEPMYTENKQEEYNFQIYYSNNILGGYLGQEVIDKVYENYKRDRESIKDEKVLSILSRLTKKFDQVNLMKWYKEGALNDKKIQKLTNMLDENPKSLEYVDYGLFKDDIYNTLPENFIDNISKFSNLSHNLVALYEHNPKLYNAVANRICSYNSIVDNYEEIQTMLENFSKYCFEINLENIDNVDIDKIIDYTKFVELNVDYKDKIPTEYSEDFQDKINEYYNLSYKKAAEKYNENLQKKEYNIKRKEELENVIEKSKDRDEIFDAKIEMIDIDAQLRSFDRTNEDNLKDKYDILFRKKFSLTYKEACSILQEYGRDLDNMENVEDGKAFLNRIQEILDGKLDLDEVYYSNEKEYTFSDVDKIKTNISRECAKTYMSNFEDLNKRLDSALKSKDNEIYKEVDVNGQVVQIIELKGKYDMLVHSTDSGFITEAEKVDDIDYKKKWEDQDNKSNHVVSTAYINQEFMGMPPVNDNGIMMGFSKMPRENIKIMGVTDINTYNREYGFNSTTRQYMSAKTMSNSARRVYVENAMEKKSPDFLIIFDDSTETVYSNTLKAAKDFGVPVVYINKKEVAKKQVNDLNQLLDDFEKNGDTRVLSTLINKYETNVAGWLLNRKKGEDESHTKDIDNSRFKEDFATVEERIQDVVSKYLDKVELSNDNPYEDLTRIAMTILHEKQLYDDSLRGGPDQKISGTEMSLDAEKIVTRLNDVMDKKGIGQYKIDENTDYRKYTSMVDLARRAICEERVSTTDVEMVKKVEEKNREIDLEEKH